jgi:hypothetical protein
MEIYYKDGKIAHKLYEKESMSRIRMYIFNSWSTGIKNGLDEQ